MRFFTYTLSSGSLIIDSSLGAMQISVQPNESSSCSISGDLPFNELQPNAITRASGETFTLVSNFAVSPLSGITITRLTGTIDIVIGVQ